jgi:cysteine sulfinate desulfinase/cysteine desulfurase-like protein
VTFWKPIFSKVSPLLRNDREHGMRDTAERHLAALGYKAALEESAQAQEAVATRLATLADELEQQGQASAAEMLQQASHRYRAYSMADRAIAAGFGTRD